MITITDLRTALLDLLHEIQDTDIKLIIGGGYGIYLKTDYVRRMALRTLLREWPEPRSTNDLDLFLRPELLIESARIKPLAEAILRLGYKAIPGAENYQFKKPGPGGGDEGGIKLDFLTGPQSYFHGTRVKTDSRRAKPTPSVGIHAHPMDEAPTCEEGLLALTLEGKLSSGEPWHAEIFLPHPYTFLMMKLFAFRDRFEDANKEFGRYHALDLYTILATTTEEEWGYSLELRDRYRDQPSVKEAGSIVSQYFSDSSHMGIVRMKESPYYRPELQLDDFISDIQELFQENPMTTK
jgi:hypothetical protein